MDNKLSNMILFLFGLLVSCVRVFSQASDCCRTIQDARCRLLCHQVHNQALPIPQMQVLITDVELCPPAMMDFWTCINNSLPAVQLMSSWPGRTCCEFALGSECRRRCNAAESKGEMLRYCRESHERDLFSCIRGQDDASVCCNKAVTPSCGIVCKGVDLASVRNIPQMLATQCQGRDSVVRQCVQKHREPQHPVAQIYLPCCDKAASTHCRDKCQSVLQTAMSENDRMDILITACSAPLLTDPMWQCFLTKEKSKPNSSDPTMYVDNAKLMCCGKAASSRCRNLCTKTYKKSLTFKRDFESSCSYIQPVSTVEASMHNCLTDVDQPCQLGCSGLSFCRNFNYRPTEMFRSCTPEADESARRVFQSWMNGLIQLPQMVIHVKDIRYCRPAMWKAIACALEVKPCVSQESHINLCKEDCLTILGECVDASRLSGETTVPALCNTLPSRSTPGACVSLETYLYESPYARYRNEVTHPCHPSPCADDEICMLKRRRCKHPENCLPYVCHKACPLGQMSRLWVPRGTRVRLPDLSMSSSPQDECHVTCHCNSRGKIENCKHLSCIRKEQCLTRLGDVKEHGEHFWKDGPQCVCNAGKILCTRRACRPSNSYHAYAGLTGNCPGEYEPVCGINGKTYPNDCVARCDGVYDIVARTSCSEMDVCAGNSCPLNHRCVPRPQICLDRMTKGDDDCPQYECVSESGSCAAHHHDPACSSSGEEFSNMCMLYSHMRTLGYRGHCQSGCSTTGVVCGHDGETYSSECAAKAARMTVDYNGKCVAFGNLTDVSVSRSLSCSRVMCPPLHPASCVGVTPPGGCCPVCASQMKLLWDTQQMKTAARHFRSKIISATDVLSGLSNHISVPECDVYGYVSSSGELVVIVAPVMPYASGLQVEACQTEAERLHNLVKSGSPNLSSYLTLSPLVLSSLERSLVTVAVPVNPSFISDTYSNHHNGGRNGGAQPNVALGTLFTVMVITIVIQKLHVISEAL